MPFILKSFINVQNSKKLHYQSYRIKILEFQKILEDRIKISETLYKIKFSLYIHYRYNILLLFWYDFILVSLLPKTRKVKKKKLAFRNSLKFHLMRDFFIFTKQVFFLNFKKMCSKINNYQNDLNNLLLRKCC